jgi:hypothetical protein
MGVNGVRDEGFGEWEGEGGDLLDFGKLHKRLYNLFGEVV